MSKPLAIIVEDDPNLNRIFSLALKTDFATESFDDGAAGLKRIVEVCPALVILDLNLPGLKGKSVLENIRTHASLDRTHVILCTADERQAELLEDEADIVMLKPVSPSQLRQIASRFVS